ncbi:solute carrier family 22 member 6-A isoform X5 [Salmo salar]|uniref:Solute carrier family 22 member 6-A isoform X5 n=1 Tax=Salmo salar TaxID=8030 RepID=A0A1S3SRW1_SALSA|nr:solute carrier family 22 member 6-A-like isoform X5 [Salmo salar]|eukprot:XP_014067070.1 PREDICTED: solute carrier family 22 member 6-A-like isoform X5 [Salmo salar]
MAPLQLAVYWRLALIFFFMAFLFFLDLFAVGRATSSCNNVRGELPAGSQTGGEVSSSAHSQNWSTWEVREVNGSLFQGTVCMDPEVMSYSQTIYMTGLLLGSLFGGALSDRYGKRAVLLVGVCVKAVTAVLPAVLPHAILFLTLRCLAGVSCCCINICSFSLGVEWSLPKYRIWPPALLSFSFSLGMMALAPLAYLTHTWTQLHLALAVPQILCLPLYYSIPESPRWLLLKRRTETLEEYRRHSPEDKHFLDLVSISPDVLRYLYECRAVRGGCLPRSVLQRPIRGSLPARPIAIGSLGQTPNLHAIPVPQWLLLPAVPARITLLCCPRVGDGSGPGGEAVYADQCVCLCTLRHRTLPYAHQKCVGLVCLCYRVGCILNAVVSPRGETIPLAAMILYGSGPIVGAGLCLFLPETSGVPLPDSLEDCDKQPSLHLPTFPSLWSSEGAQRMPQLTKPVHSWETDPEKPSHNPQDLN